MNTNSKQVKAYVDMLGLDKIIGAQTDKELEQAVESGTQSFWNGADNKAYKQLQSLAKKWGGSDDKKLLNEYVDKFIEIGKIDGVFNGRFVETTVSSGHITSVTKLRQKLIIEYNAQSVSEMMIIDMSINAYFRSLHISQLYSALIMDKDGSISYNQLKINILKELTKHIESANRQFMSSLSMLKEMKRPAINVKVHSKQAFIAQNQQFNKNA